MYAVSSVVKMLKCYCMYTECTLQIQVWASGKLREIPELSCECYIIENYQFY